jgi:deazaflavin-dependent oxidoreductase (nitroreductase family)
MSGAARRGPLLTFLWRAHRLWYRLSDGRLGAKFRGWDVLVLTATGRRSGAPRSVTLNYVRDGDAFVVVGSNAGDDRDPQWWENLKAHPNAEVRIGPKRVAVRPARPRPPSGSCSGQDRGPRSVVRGVRARDEAADPPIVVLEPTG